MVKSYNAIAKKFSFLSVTKSAPEQVSERISINMLAQLNLDFKMAPDLQFPTDADY